nr:efflux RND transporter permease subunit [Nannocystis sp.]
MASDKRDFETSAFAAEWRERVGPVVEAKSVQFNFNMGPSAGRPVDVEISHRDDKVLEAAANDVVAALRGYGGVTDVENGVALGKPQLDLTLRPEAVSLGLNATDIARQVRGAFYGSEALRQQDGRNEVRVLVRLPAAERRNENDISDLLIRTSQGGEIALREAAEIKRGRSWPSIERADGRRIIHVTADIRDGETTPALVLGKLQEEVLAALPDEYPGLSWGLGGENREQRESLGSLGTGAMMALLAIYGLLAVPFRSYIQPFIVMAAIPFGLVGAIGVSSPGDVAVRGGRGRGGAAVSADHADLDHDLLRAGADDHGALGAGPLPDPDGGEPRLRGDVRDRDHPADRAGAVPRGRGREERVALVDGAAAGLDRARSAGGGAGRGAGRGRERSGGLMMSFFQDAPGNPDLFLADPTLRAELARRLPASLLTLAQARCAAIGVASTELLPRLAAQAEAQPPEHVPYDPWGRRVDEIRTSPAWEALRVFSATQGLVATGYEAGLGEHRRVIQAALLHPFSASSATYSCPLAMTDAAARVLIDLAPASLRERLVPGLTTTDPACFITSGQWMTERTGGSDVGGTETVARPAGVVGGEQRYTLHGVKWFTSATTSEMALTLARIDDGAQAPVAGSRGLSLFCVEVTREAGRGWQGITVNRLKDKLGTRALPTAELTLDGAPATLIGEPGRGVANISGMLNVTRLYNAIASASGMRRACALARDYAERRVAFGRKLVDLPLHGDPGRHGRRGGGRAGAGDGVRGAARTQRGGHRQRGRASAPAGVDPVGQADDREAGGGDRVGGARVLRRRGLRRGHRAASPAARRPGAGDLGGDHQRALAGRAARGGPRGGVLGGLGGPVPKVRAAGASAQPGRGDGGARRGARAGRGGAAGAQ